ncbi:MAG: RsmE family RNA methyltransferase [Gemmatimonadaceae bacterium]
MVERASRAPVGTFHAPGAWERGARVELAATSAHHALVKRLAVGDVVHLTSGDGRRASGEIAELSKSRMVVALGDDPVDEVPIPARVELWAPVGDRDRMLMLAEKATELGVSSWRPIVYARSRSVSPRGEGEAFREKLRARQVSALEQSGGAWLPDAHAEISFASAMMDASNSRLGMRLLLDGDGEPVADVLRGIETPVCIALGPEGGLEESERAEFIRAGWRAVSLGRNVLRFETAAIAALAIVRSHLR